MWVCSHSFFMLLCADFLPYRYYNGYCSSLSQYTNGQGLIINFYCELIQFEGLGREKITKLNGACNILNINPTSNK